MTNLLRPCVVCGELSTGSRCAEHPAPSERKLSAHRRGYDAAWFRLSAKARRLQPFCSDCGATEDLTTDHTPEAWARKVRGLPIRLADVDVVCRRCNSRRGAARGSSAATASAARGAARLEVLPQGGGPTHVESLTGPSVSLNFPLRWPLEGVEPTIGPDGPGSGSGDARGPFEDRRGGLS